MITWSGYFHAEWDFLPAYGHRNIAEGTHNYVIMFFGFFLLLEYKLGKI